MHHVSNRCASYPSNEVACDFDQLQFDKVARSKVNESCSISVSRKVKQKKFDVDLGNTSTPENVEIVLS